jgi:hypothetical protein
MPAAPSPSPVSIRSWLVVKDGYRAAFIYQVDPANGPAPAKSLNSRPAVK